MTDAAEPPVTLKVDKQQLEDLIRRIPELTSRKATEAARSVVAELSKDIGETYAAELRKRDNQVHALHTKIDGAVAKIVADFACLDRATETGDKAVTANLTEHVDTVAADLRSELDKCYEALSAHTPLVEALQVAIDKLELQKVVAEADYAKRMSDRMAEQFVAFGARGDEIEAELQALKDVHDATMEALALSKADLEAELQRLAENTRKTAEMAGKQAVESVANAAKARIDDALSRIVERGHQSTREVERRQAKAKLEVLQHVRDLGDNLQEKIDREKRKLAASRAWVTKQENDRQEKIEAAVKATAEAVEKFLTKAREEHTEAIETIAKIDAEQGVLSLRLVPNWRGPYSDETQYQRGDVVMAQGSSWIALQTTQGQRPAVADNSPWQVFAAAGVGGGFTGGKNAAGAVQAAIAMWQPDTFYKTGAKVIVQIDATSYDIWERLTNGTSESSVTPEEAANWRPVTPTPVTFSTTEPVLLRAGFMWVNPETGVTNIAYADPVQGLIWVPFTGAGIDPIGPTNTVPPEQTGDVAVGDTLTVTTGTWTGTGTVEFSYQWFRDSTPVSGALASTYVVQESDILTTVNVRVTATDDTGSRSLTTVGVEIPAAPTVIALADGEVVIDGDAVTYNGTTYDLSLLDLSSGPVFLTGPTATGTLEAGQTATAASGLVVGLVSDGPIVVNYAWQRGGELSTGSTRVLTSDDVLIGLDLQQTATNGAGSTTGDTVEVIAAPSYTAPVVEMAAGAWLTSADPMFATVPTGLLLQGSFFISPEATEQRFSVIMSSSPTNSAEWQWRDSATGTPRFGWRTDDGSILYIDTGEGPVGSRVDVLQQIWLNPVSGRMPVWLALRIEGGAWTVYGNTTGTALINTDTGMENAPAYIGRDKNTGSPAFARQISVIRAWEIDNTTFVDLDDPAVRDAFFDANGARSVAVANSVVGSSPLINFDTVDHWTTGVHGGAEAAFTVTGTITEVV